MTRPLAGAPRMKWNPSSCSHLTATLQYDGLDRLTRVAYDQGGLALENRIDYSDAARTVTRTDGKGQATVYTLRPEVDLVWKIRYHGHTAQYPDNEIFQYDRGGLVLRHSRAYQGSEPSTWDIEYTRDRLGQLTRRGRTLRLMGSSAGT